jgi:hypothetical protein
MYELNIILRQQHGFPFAEALNRLRTGDHTAEDLEFLKRFEIDPSNPPPEYSIFYRHIFATHRQRDNHNQRVLESVAADEIDLEAKDFVIATFVHDKDRRFFLQKAKNMDDSKSATLLSVLQLKVGIIMEVTTNVDVPDGLYNGARGFLWYMGPPGVSSPDILWIEFTDPSIGQHARSRHFKLFQTHPEIARVCIPVFRVSWTFQATSRQESTILRWQFPVQPATAGTFHHNQGLTLREEAVNF